MPGTRAVDALERAGVEFALHTYEIDAPGDTTFGAAVAAALGVSPERVFKTLIAEVDGRPVVAIVPVIGHLSLKALARAAQGKRAVMAQAEIAERITGYVVGGISPFAHRRRVPTWVDESLTLHDRVFVSGGRRGLQVEVAPGDLIALTAARTAPLAG